MKKINKEQAAMIAKHSIMAKKIGDQRREKLRIESEKMPRNGSFDDLRQYFKDNPVDLSITNVINELTPKRVKDPAKALAIGVWARIISLSSIPDFPSWSSNWHEWLEHKYGKTGYEAGLYVFDLYHYYTTSLKTSLIK